MKYRADFHIHTCLSPCASLEMSPAAIVRKARDAGLAAVAIADHNCALNGPAFEEACHRLSMARLHGIEVTTAEEAHVLCLFDRLEQVLEVGRVVYDRLPDVANIPEKFGDQPVVNADDEVERFVEKYLGTATDLSLSELGGLVRRVGGLFIPAHVDKPVFSVISQLGFLPEEDLFDGIEITRPGEGGQALHPRVANSDAHYLEDIGTSFTEYDSDGVTVASLRRALQQHRATPVFGPRWPRP